MRIRLLLPIALFVMAVGLQASGRSTLQLPAHFDDCISQQLRATTPTASQSSLYDLYRDHAFELFFDPPNSFYGRTQELVGVFSSAERFGLQPAKYDVAAQIDKFTAACPATSPRILIDAAVATVTLRFTNHLFRGRIDPQDAGFHIPAKPALDALQVLKDVASGADIEATLLAYEPTSPYYHQLKAALAPYRALAANKELTQLPALTVRSLHSGDIYAGATQLRALLRATGDLPVDDATQIAVSTDVFDDELAAGLLRFQQRHGLTPDGALGTATYRALTTPFSQRVRQIELTMERWRWLPPLEPPMVIINIPQFMLFALPRDRDSNEILEMSIVAGKPLTQTPVFMDEIEAVTFRPYWNVPHSIVTKELLPLIGRHPDYLELNHFEIVRGQGDDAAVVAVTPEHLSALARGQLRVRQRPGTDNALGLLKFELPNSYNIYLHDTPGKRLFQQSKRAFSHGCIRVNDPARLAEYVLQDAANAWDRSAIEAAMNGTDTFKVALPKPIPVLVVYGTALASERRGIAFFEDIYKQDRRLEALLLDRDLQAWQR